MTKYQIIRLVILAGTTIALCSIVVFAPAENWVYLIIGLILSGTLFLLLNRK